MERLCNLEKLGFEMSEMHGGKGRTGIDRQGWVAGTCGPHYRSELPRAKHLSDGGLGSCTSWDRIDLQGGFGSCMSWDGADKRGPEIMRELC